MSKVRRVLVTGGTGYVGGRLIRQFRDNGWLVRVGSRQSEEQVIDLFGPLVEYSKFDAEDETLAIEPCVADCSAVVHLAGMNAQCCGIDPELATQVNVAGTKRLLSASQEKGVQRFIRTSTIHVFGSPLVGKLTEATKPRPTHPYGSTNAAAEALTLTTNSHSMATAVVRLSNAFGKPFEPGDGHSDRPHGPDSCWKLVVNDLCKQAIENNAVVLNSSGEQFRDFAPLTTIVRGLQHLVEMPLAKLSGTFHLGSRSTQTVRSIATTVIDRCESLFGFRPSLTRGDLPETSPTFEFTIDRLLQTGFESNVSAIYEIDECLRFLTASRNQATN